MTYEQKRFELAKAAMQELIRNSSYVQHPYDINLIAKDAAGLAHALLKELGEEDKPSDKLPERVTTPSIPLQVGGDLLKKKGTSGSISDLLQKDNIEEKFVLDKDARKVVRIDKDKDAIIDNIYKYYRCPNCKYWLSIECKDNYCSNCGSKIEWV